MSMASAQRNERLHKKDKKEDQRSPSQRDRDRVLFSSALRRLNGVTQVVDPAEGHIFHNRLTHTLNVAQIARRLSEKLLAEYHKNGIRSFIIDPEVVEAAALIHDLGHPPFGHITEKKLDELLISEGELDGYEGNAQSFRIVTQLAVRRDSLPGLNLTRATLNAILKYPWFRRMDGKHHRKWGVYTSEADIFHWVREYSTGDQQSLEAQIMDWADDIAFSVHDVEDFYRAGLIPLDRLAYSEAERDRFVTAVSRRWKENPRDDDYPPSEFRMIFEKLLTLIPIGEPFSGSRRQVAYLSTVTANLINRYILATRLRKQSYSDEWKVRVDPTYLKEIKMLKQLTWHYVIESPAVATQQHGKARIIQDLFRILLDALTSRTQEWLYILPESAREYIDDKTEDKAFRRVSKPRLVADVIASMTDKEALAIHRRLMGIDPGSLLDALPK